MTARILSAAFAAALLAGTASAADKPKKKAAGPFDADKAFKQLDANSDGKLSADEFKNVLSALPPAGKKAKPLDPDALFKVLDTDGDKSISADEFKAIKDQLPEGKKKANAKKKLK